MASDIQKLYSLPDVSFIDDISAETILQEMISDFQEMHEELTGEYIELTEFDRYRIMMNATVLKLYQAFQCIDRAGKMNLLKYSTGDYLINLGANRGVLINEEKSATCMVKFKLANPLTFAVTIPIGTRITAGDGVFFESSKYGKIKANNTEVIVPVICQVTGTIGNGYEIGQLNILTDPIPYVEEVENTTISDGGEDVQSDEGFREKIFLAPSGYTTTGSEDAYIYWVNECSTLISDVKVNTPQDDTVQIIVVKKDGEIPDESFLLNIKNYLENSNIKPLTEKVEVIAPTIIHYDVEGAYYINRSDVNKAEIIHKQVTEQLNQYLMWQKEKIGRDISPFYLQHLLALAGVKRVVLTSPQFIDIDSTSIAIEGNVNLVYGGVEDD